MVGSWTQERVQGCLAHPLCPLLRPCDGGLHAPLNPTKGNVGWSPQPILDLGPLCMSLFPLDLFKSNFSKASFSPKLWYSPCPPHTQELMTRFLSCLSVLLNFLVARVL